MENKISEILGFEVERLTAENSSEQIFDFEIVEGSAIYNQDETISIEKLDSSELEDIYYVTIKVNGTWEMEGYYQAI
jgi:hypothetical protein